MRPPYRPGYGDSGRERSGPSDEILAIDAPGEERSFNVLYDRYADSLYRFFVGAAGDVATADRLLADLIADLPEDLHHFAAGERSFPGWIFSRASRRFEREVSSPLRFIRRATAAFSSTSTHRYRDGEQEVDQDVDRYLTALQQLPPIERQVMVLTVAVGLSQTEVSEAIGLPTLAVSARLGTGSSTLAAHLEGTAPADARSFLGSALQSVTLSDEQRERHRRSVRPAFGHTDYSDDTGSSLARQLAVLGMVVLVGFIGLFGWDYVATRLAEEPPEEETLSDTGTGNGAASENVSAKPTPDDIVAGEPTPPCPADERRAVLDEFVAHFNDGEFDELRAMLPEENDNPREITQAVSEDARELTTIIPFEPELYDPDVTISRLRSRYEGGQRWEIFDAVAAEDYQEWFGSPPIDLYRDWTDDEPQLDLLIVTEMTISPYPTVIERGPVVVDCSADQIVAWGLDPVEPRGNEPVDVIEFLYNTTSLQPGEERIWQVRASTMDRADAGGLYHWDLEWRQAVDEDGTLLQRGTVYDLGGQEVISYQHDGERWRLEQRGWTRHGTSMDIPLPEEITQVVPWLNRSAGIVHLNSSDIPPRATQHLGTGSIDLSRSRGMHADVYSAPEAERSFALQIEVGGVAWAQLVEDRQEGGLIQRPRIYFLNVDRVHEFDPEDYRFMFYPRYLDRDTRIPRFTMPDDELERLTVEEFRFSDDASLEQYGIRWNGVALDLTVLPSRGGIDIPALTEEYDELWRSDTGGYRYGVYRWSEGALNGLDDVPTEALWDNGRYRFELSLSEGTDTSGDGWNLGDLIDLADALAPAES